jgi:reactive intermediate/imine deaminase
MPFTHSIVPVQTASAPSPLGAYAQAVVHGGVVYVSGQLPLDVDQPVRITPASPFDAQLEQLLTNCAAILQAAGSQVESILSLTLYLTDLSNWDEADRMLGDFLLGHRPARSVLCLPAIAVQASMVAAVKGPGQGCGER